MFWIVFLATMGLSLLAAGAVKSAYARWSRVPARSGLTGGQLAQDILRRAGIRDVVVTATRGTLADHYDPVHRRLVLSEDNYYGTSIAALGVSAHECGHAVQHARNYMPLNLRMAAVGITQFASSWLLLLPMIGAMFSLIPWGMAGALIAIGWGVMMLFNLVTLPVEFDATARAKRILVEGGYVAPDEMTGVDKVLNAAAWTYVAAFITSLGWMLMHLLPMLGAGESE